ncbi:hypothetical protein, partial [uncultured Dokdonia sp.]|uniref:hypothetical protein n=1 Tax=uncultured Dokdonia sp. TaxID=575653 RepID=UPI00261D1B60
EVEDVLFEMAHLGASIAFSVENSAKALEATFGISIKDMATLLYTKGVDVVEAATSLKNVFGVSADEVACVLEHANYPKEVIENAFHKLGGAFEHVYDEIVEHIFDWGLW